MSRIVVADPRTGRATEADFATLVDVLKGASIVSLADSDHFIEFGLSERLLIRIKATDQGMLQVTVVSTLNPDEVPPMRLQIVAEDEEPSAALVEERLRSLRQLYAALYLLNAGRIEELATAVHRNPSVDIEQQFLNDRERLQLEAAGPGSWWLTVVTGIKNVASRTTLNTLSLLYGEGRGMLLERVQAGTLSQEEDARAKTIANDRARALAAIEVARELEKIENPETRKLVWQLLSSNAEAVRPRSAPLLPPPDDLR